MNMSKHFVAGGDYSVYFMAQCQANRIIRLNLYSRPTRSGRCTWSEWFERMFGTELKKQLLDVHGYGISR